MSAAPEADLLAPRSPDPLIAVALAAAAGDPRAMTRLVADTSTVVWRTCAALVDRACADDLTQETYLRAVRSLPTYRGESSPVRWLLTIARRVCAEEIANRQRHRATVERLRGERRPSSVNVTGLVELSDGLAQLSPARRNAFVLTAVAGLPYADAAAACGCPIGTIRSRVARAREDLIAWMAAAEEHPVVSGAPARAGLAR